MVERVLGFLLVVPFVLGMAAAPTAQAGDVEFTFKDPAIVESSGLVAQDGLFFTTNDSGDEGRVFAVDPATGRTVGVTEWSDDPVDVEALAPAGDGRLWVGDIGDNRSVRDSVRVTRLPVGRGDRTAEGESYELVYPEGAQNAESLLADPTTGRLYLATKDVFGAHLYAAPAQLSADRPNRLTQLGRVLPIATDAAFFPDGQHVIVRDYGRAAVYTFPGMLEIGSLALPDQRQGEGIAVNGEGDVFVSSEGQFSPVLRVTLPYELAQAAVPKPPAPPATSSASREGIELPEATNTEPSAWPWFLTAWIVLGGLVVLLRSMRRR